jgi:hypothetical protein
MKGLKGALKELEKNPEPSTGTPQSINAWTSGASDAVFVHKTLDSSSSNAYITVSSLRDDVSRWPRMACASGFSFFQVKNSRTYVTFIYG